MVAATPMLDVAPPAPDEEVEEEVVIEEEVDETSVDVD